MPYSKVTADITTLRLMRNRGCGRLTSNLAGFRCSRSCPQTCTSLDEQMMNQIGSIMCDLYITRSVISKIKKASNTNSQFTELSRAPIADMTDDATDPADHRKILPFCG
ncbi:hypothetical protein EVAR_56865_1 [Eumeta japonica]|uniref:Uncharacterized protein n=1 Tax=Eumeta variegata TaxID=151549 RepID=A0A4C1YYY4_EUMVA|nr:hypothetical protein EVAR_56865_1 [Eumeta japonica]